MNSENNSYNFMNNPNSFINNNFNFNIHQDTNMYFKDLCSVDPLSDDYCISNLDSILEIKLNIEIYDCNILNTPCGQKIAIKGFKLFKVYYSEPEKRDLVFCKSFNIPFFESITLDTCEEVDICGLCANVICCDAIKDPCKNIYLSSMICFKVTVKIIKNRECDINSNDCCCKDDCPCNYLDDTDIDIDFKNL